MKRFILMVLVCISLSGLVSCGKANKVVEERAQVVVDAFSDGDMATINKTIFGLNSLQLDSELSDIWEESIETEAGVLESVFEYVTLKLEKTTESVIEYEIKAPDMTNVFVDIDMNTTNITETELLEYIPPSFFSLGHGPYLCPLITCGPCSIQPIIKDQVLLLCVQTWPSFMSLFPIRCHQRSLYDMLLFYLEEMPVNP